MDVRNSLALAAIAGLVLGGCGKADTDNASSTAPALSGVVTSDAPANSVALRDASDPASVRVVTPGADGSFSFDATGLTPPFLLRAEGVGPALYTIVRHSGNADINGLTSAAVAGATRGEDAGEAWSGWSDGEGGDDGAAGRIASVIRSLRTVLKPLFDLYHVGRIGGDDDEGDVSGMRALLRDVSFTVSNGVVTVTNRATGGVIFTGPLNDLASGAFHPENMPAGPGGTPPPPPATCTGFTYSDWTPATCPASGQQTRTVVSSTPAGCTGGNPVLTQTCTPPPPPPVTCTGCPYCAWTPATCPASGQQTRTVVTASPAGCTGGNPVLTQTCTPPATNPVTTANIVSSCTSCHGLTSNNTVYRSGGYSKKGATSAQWLSTVNSMMNMGAMLAPGTTAQNYADFLANAP